MRIDQLRLRAWGPFRDVTVDLSGGSEGLHLIEGPNEVGKSSALRAIASLLYGIPTQCGDAFMHEKSALRIGAVLRNAKGDTLSVTRRKGNKNTLLGDKDEAIADSVLARYLGGMQGELFKSLFGIDHATLRSGARDLLNVNGNLGQAIVAASAGYKDLKGVLDALDGQAEALFKPGRGKAPAINQALSDLKAARETVSQATVRWGKYDDARRSVEKHEAEREEFVAGLVELLAARNRLVRIRDALPLITERAGVIARLDGMGEVIALPGGFANDRMLLEQKLEAARDGERVAADDLHAIEKILTDLVVPSGIVEQATVIAELLQAVGVHNKGATDLSTLKTRLAQNEEDALALLRELDRPASLDQVDAVRLPAAARIKIQDLSSQHQTLQDRRETADQNVVELAADIERAHQDQEALGAPVDPSALRAAVDLAQQPGDLDKAKAMALRQLEEEEINAQAVLKRLGLWNGPLDQAGTLPIPSDQTIERFAGALAAAQNDARNVSALLKQAQATGARIDSDLRALDLAGAVPTEQDLGCTRQKRDQAWHEIQGAWRGGAAHDDRQCDSYGRLVEGADDVADRLRRESERVIAHANLVAEKIGNDQSTATIRVQMANAEKTAEDIERDWVAAWAPAGITPLPPAEMRSWVLSYGRLATKAADLGVRRRGVQSLDESIRGLRDGLVAALRTLGEADLPEGRDLAPAVLRAKAALERINGVEIERVRLAKLIGELELRRAKAESNVAQAQTALAGWNESWTDAVKQVGATQGMSPAQASVFVAKVQDLIETMDKAAGNRRRIQDIESDAKAFEREVASLVDRVAPDLAGVPPAQAVAALNARLKEATTNAARRVELEKKCEERTNARNEALATIRQCEKDLAGLCSIARCARIDELAAAEERSADAAGLRQRAGEIDQQLRLLAAGTELSSFVAEAHQENADAIPAKLAAIDAGTREGEAHRKEMDQEIGAQKADLEKIMGGSDAAEAAEKAESFKAQIRDGAEDYLRVRVASAILRRNIEAYRREHQEPIMNRASELFSLLTTGSFQSLRVGYDEDDEPTILGVRPSDEEVPIDGMSDGTRDQLYLALRLASIEGYLDRNEPVPFIVDDIFVHFDDRRSAAALEVLGDLSRRTQVIVFTHHSHLVDVARTTAAADVLSMHALGS